MKLPLSPMKHNLNMEHFEDKSIDKPSIFIDSIEEKIPTYELLSSSRSYQYLETNNSLNKSSRKIEKLLSQEAIVTRIPIINEIT